MIFKRPSISGNSNTPAFELLKEALSQYCLKISQEDNSRELRSLGMDDIDFLEAIQLIEKAIAVKIDKRKFRRTTKLHEVVALIDEARGRKT